MSIITQKQGTLEYLTAEEISVPHCFTTRHGGVSTGSHASLNLAIGRGDAPENVEANLRLLGFALGFDPEKLVLTRRYGNLRRSYERQRSQAQTAYGS